LPIWHGFQGGKGVATAAGVLFGIHWALGLAALSTWLIMAFFFRYSSLAALTTAIFAPLFAYLMFFLQQTISQISCIAVLMIGIVLIWRHQSNIQKLMNGTEGKIGSKK
jgi:glycerol-3-phosphate acyltransferase PlsY